MPRLLGNAPSCCVGTSSLLKKFSVRRNKYSRVRPRPTPLRSRCSRQRTPSWLETLGSRSWSPPERLVTSTSLGMSPFKALYGMPPPKLLSYPLTFFPYFSLSPLSPLPFPSPRTDPISSLFPSSNSSPSHTTLPQAAGCRTAPPSMHQGAPPTSLIGDLMAPPHKPLSHSLPKTKAQRPSLLSLSFSPPNATTPQPHTASSSSLRWRPLSH
ncbi:hypothetical protein I3843_Q056900 [Carya illinoinensis]|nr:hypothetical protein I3843_Q056900 [Carya illinoinensis]